MIAPLDKIASIITAELEWLWAAHKAVNLEGQMCLYTLPTQVPFRAKQPALEFWFGPGDTQAAVEQILEHYNKGVLPNSPLLLNPIVHDKDHKPLGSGIIWSTSLSLGIDVLKDEASERLLPLNVVAGHFHRGENEHAGLKIIGLCHRAQKPVGEGKTVTGCRELYELADITSEQYAGHYLLSGISYLTNNGLFQHPDSAELTQHTERIDVQNVLDAAQCWNAYERHHSLYQKFGTDTSHIEANLRFFNLVARDVQLFDATGPMRKDADATFEFIVPGLIPRGSVTLLAATGGTGKSSLAHRLCILASIDYKAGEEAPQWLGQRLAIEKCQGICVYFSGEDGPPIINARAQLYDPERRGNRLMFQRTDFGEGVTFAQHIRRLHKIPDVPIMVIDPARKYLSGDEEDAGAVSEFFEAIEEFAIQKGTAVVVVHHLKKNAAPKTAHEVLDMLRGSQVFIDRPRVVIGMFRDGPYTIAGLAKNNIPPNLGMVTEERVFARDPRKLDLVWLPGHQGVRNAELSPEELDQLEAQARQDGH